MKKEVGKIKNNKATFLQVIYSFDIKTGEIDLDVKKDSRLLNDTYDEELKEIISASAQRIYEIFEEQLGE